MPASCSLTILLTADVLIVQYATFYKATVKCKKGKQCNVFILQIIIAD